uniref:Zinc finger protein 281 n=1 Tax=Tetraodon nigroviridis TaxID=99883 RepID=H3DG84_TETNG
DGQEGKPRKRRSEAKQSLMLDADGCSLSPGSKPHMCEHCSASFRSSYHLRRHVLIHTGERPFRCSQCNMSFIQKYLLQRHEKIHSGEKPFSCDQCNMRFIQKYHMERHKRTHSGEKPYRCETCQQYFSRTDRLLKHKRTCGEAIKKGLEPGMMDLACLDMGQGSYGITQGNAGRKRGRSKNAADGGERKRKRGYGGAARISQSHASVAGGYGIQEYSVENQVSSSTGPGPSMHQDHPGHAPKMAFKKAHRKNLSKVPPAHAKEGLLEQRGAMDDLGLVHATAAKVAPASSNYDDAMQFLKKRRYLQPANNASASGPPGGMGGSSSEFDMSLGHMTAQHAASPGVVSGVLDSDAPLGLDKSGIPDEVLQSILDHYTQKADGSHQDVHFHMAEPQVELSAASANGADMAHGSNAPSLSGDKTVMLHEYSRFLLQALERTSHSAGFPPASEPFTSSCSGNPLYADKNIYTTSPLECGYGQSAPSPSLPSSVPKSHFVMLTGSSPQHSFHLSSLDAAPPLTPSQELTEQMEKQHSSTPPSYQPSYQIENFAQAFGSQFKSDGHGLSYATESGAEEDHRLRTSVSQFSGFTSLLSDVNEPVSSGPKTTTSQSYR